MATQSFIQLPPDSTGKKLRTRERVIGLDTVHDQGVFQTAPPTFYALADAVAFANNKHMMSIFNAAGSGVFLNLQKLFLINNQIATATGVALRLNVARLTAAHTGGTDIVPTTCDTANDALPAQVTVKTNATATAGTLLFPITLNNDEIGATMAFPGAQLLAGLNWFPEGNEIQPYRLREGQGLTIQNITNTTVGSFAFLLVFTVEEA